jgi:hypothetical protein
MPMGYEAMVFLAVLALLGILSAAEYLVEKGSTCIKSIVTRFYDVLSHIRACHRQYKDGANGPTPT